MFVSRRVEVKAIQLSVYLNTYKMNRLINWPNKRSTEKLVCTQNIILLYLNLLITNAGGSLRNGNYSKGVSRAKDPGLA